MKKLFIFITLLFLSGNVAANGERYGDWNLEHVDNKIILFTSAGNGMLSLICIDHRIKIFTTIGHHTPKHFKFWISHKQKNIQVYEIHNTAVFPQDGLNLMQHGYSMYVTYPSERTIKYSLRGSEKAIHALEHKCKH